MMFRVTCADRDTGAEYTVDVEAPTASQATRRAAEQGHLSSTAEQIPEPTTGDFTTHELLRQIREEQMQTRMTIHRIGKARLIRAPISTIAVSIIVAMILWGVLCFLLFMAFGALLAGAGIAAGASR
jgi:hypothetical protein